MIDAMKNGSVIVDLAAATGGNCEYTQAGKIVTTPNGVKVLGYTDLPARLPTQSSQLYSTNLVNLSKLLCKEKDGNIDVNFDDVVLRNMTVVKDGEVTFPPPKISVSAAPAKKVEAAKKEEVAEEKPGKLKWVLAFAFAALFALIAHFSPSEFLSHFTVFALACVVGYYVVWNVTHSLHTPLMSVTNAISGIIVVGSILQMFGTNVLIDVLSFIAITIASINIFGGFTVTQRMLKMFKKG
jgi:NAD(P) transhydrogenase subunit alpha